MSLVLYLEDTDDQRDLVQLVLRLQGINVEVASDGEEGLAKLESLKPDLIIVDLGLPSLDGFEVIAQVRANPATHQLPIIVLSAWTSVKHRQRAQEYGADKFVCKPFDVEELTETVLALLPR